VSSIFPYGDPRTPDPNAPLCPGCGEPLDLIETLVSDDGLGEIWDCSADPDCLNALRMTWRPRSRKPRISRVPVDAA
jgi:hypothetical protein